MQARKRSGGEEGIGRHRFSGAALGLLAFVLMGPGRCVGPVPAPSLLASQPAAGATDVATSEWLRLEFASALAPGLHHGFALACDDQPHPFALELLSPAVLLVNPIGALPTAAACALSWRGPGDLRETLAFATAAAGAPAVVLYDRDDGRRTTPFPDDFWLGAGATGGSAPELAIRVTGLGGLEKTLVDALLVNANRLDGASPIAHFVVELSDAPDPASLPLTPAASLDPLASVGLFRLAPGPDQGARVPFRIDVRSDTTSAGRTSHTLLIFPSIPLEPGEAYGLVVTRRAQVAPERPLGPSPFFAAALAGPAPGESAAVAAVRALSGSVLAVLSERGVPRLAFDDVALAVRISVRSTDGIPADLMAARQQIQAAAPPGVTITSVEPDTTAGSPIAAVVRGTWQAPEFRDGSSFARDAGGLPVLQGANEVPFVLVLPDVVANGPAPLTMYQHGNPGSQEEVLRQGRNYLAQENFAVIGFTDNLNREVSAGIEDDEAAIEAQVFAIFTPLLLTQRLPDYYGQTNAEMIGFVRMFESLRGLDVLPMGAPDGIPDLDLDAPLTYVGVSQGANYAPGLLPYAPEIRAAALVVGGSRLVETLIHQQAALFVTTVGDLFPGLSPADIWFGAALFQMIFDDQDPHNHAPFLYRDPLPLGGASRRASVLLIEGLDDSLVPNHATDSLAWALGPLPHLAPVQRPVAFLETAPGPLQGNVDAETTAALFQYVPVGVPGVPPSPGCVVLTPRSANEGHYCAQSAAESLLQRILFFASALAEAAPRIESPPIP